MPQRFWINTAIFIVGGWMCIMLLPHAAQMNKVVLAMVILVSTTTVGFQWIWERNEPRFLTPYVNLIAPFFPGKDAFN